MSKNRREEMGISNHEMLPLDPESVKLIEAYKRQCAELLRKWQSGWQPESLPTELKALASEWLSQTTPEQLEEYISSVRRFTTKKLLDSVVLTSEQTPDAYFEGSKGLVLNVKPQPDSALAELTKTENEYVQFESIQIILHPSEQSAAHRQIAAHFLGDNETLRNLQLAGLTMTEVSEGKFKIKRTPEKNI